MPKDVRSTRRYRVARALMFQIYGTTCHLCGHPGARTADHLEPVSRDPGQPIDPHTMRPAHGVKNQLGPGGVRFDARCPTCRRSCNSSRQAKPLEVVLAASEDEDYEDWL